MAPLTKQNPKTLSAIVRAAARVKKPVFVFVFVLLHYFVFRNFVLLSKDMIFGDFSAQSVAPGPIYGLERISATKGVAIKYHAQNRLGVDFAQIYFPSQRPNSLGDSYSENTTLDPAQRPSRYAPLVEYVCAMTICKLDFGYASFWHMVIQILAFFLVAYLAFRSLGLKNHFWPFVLFSDSCMFLTPVGVTWFGLGQFSLYVATGSLLLLWGMLKRNIVLILLSALFAFVKWTSLPFGFTALCVYILISKSRDDLQFSLLSAILFGSLFVVLSLPFIPESLAFIQGLLYQESHRIPQGVSLAIYVPKPIVKSLPFLLSVAGYGMGKINKAGFIDLLPFLAGASILLLLYPTLAFDYSAPILLGLIPFMIYWAEAHRGNPAGQRMRQAILWTFLLFILLASYSTTLTGSILVDIIIYLVVSIALMVIPIFLPKHVGKSAHVTA